MLILKNGCNQRFKYQIAKESSFLLFCKLYFDKVRNFNSLNWLKAARIMAKKTTFLKGTINQFWCHFFLKEERGERTLLDLQLLQILSQQCSSVESLLRKATMNLPIYNFSCPMPWSFICQKSTCHPSINDCLKSRQQ